MANFHSQVTFNSSSGLGSELFDGLYLDDSQAIYSDVFAQILLSQTHLFDIDGDGQPNAVGDINAQYMAYRPYFFAKLREAVGPDRVLLANSG